MFDEKAQKNGAAANIQAKYRGKKARQEKEESKLAATKIQASLRGKTSRKNLTRSPPPEGATRP